MKNPNAAAWRSMMRHAIITCAISLVLSTTCVAQQCHEPFDGPDGSTPWSLFSTGDPADAGAFALFDNALVHSTAGSAHYISQECDTGGALGISLWVEGTNWDLAWDITMVTYESGRCLRLSHGEYDSGWRYTFSEFAWEMPEGATPPETRYTWHRGDALRTVHVATPEPLVGWHFVEFTPGSHATVFVDGEMVFDEECELLVTGHGLGFGCSGVGGGSPAFDSVEVQYGSPVAPLSWGRIKALYCSGA